MRHLTPALLMSNKIYKGAIGKVEHTKERKNLSFGFIETSY